ncbi:MAG: MMPL family transporter, partial [Bacteroidota bacterium]
MRERRGPALILLLALLGGLAFLSSRIAFEEDISKLIPVNREAQELQNVLKSVNFADKIIVHLQRGDEGRTDDLISYASVFLDSLAHSSSEYVQNIQGKVKDEDMLDAIDFVYENIPLFLDATDYDAIEQKLSEQSLAEITEQHYKTLISPSGILAKKTLLKDPLGISFIALKKLQELGFREDFVIKDGFLLSKDEEHILLFIDPVFESNDTARNTPFANTLYRLQKRLNTQFEGRVGMEYFGGALIAVANAQQIKKDIQFTVGIAMTVLLLVLVFFYRKLALPLILFTPTAIGGLFAVALLYLIRTKVSAISLGIGSVLLGITLDYALHILTHIRNGNSVERLYKEVAPAIVMSSLTTACAFLCLLFLKSQALQDLGIFAAVSVLGSAVFALVFIPQVYQGKHEKNIRHTVLDRFAALDFHKSKWAIALVSIVFLLGFFTYSKVGFDKDIGKLNYEPEELVQARKRLDALTNLESKSIYVTAYGTDLEQVLQVNDRVNARLQQLKSQHKILDFSGVGAFVGSQKRQMQKLNLWNDFWDTGKKDSLQRNLVAIGSTFGFKPTTFNAFYALLNSDFNTLPLQDFKRLKTIPVGDFVNADADLITANSLIKLDSAQIAPVKKIFENMPRTVIIDRQGVNERFLGNLKTDFNRLIGYSVLAVLLILALYYRSF